MANQKITILQLPSATGFGPTDYLVGVQNGTTSKFSQSLIGSGATGATGGTGETGPAGETGATGSVLVSYVAYSALLTQRGIDDPTWIELENTLETSFTWHRESQGNYYAEASSNVFFENQTVMVPGVINFAALNSNGYTANKFFITTLNKNIMMTDYSLIPLDECLNNTFVEIRAYKSNSSY